jgi:hypothetical protein
MALAFASTCVFGYVLDCYPRLAEEAFVAINTRNLLTFGLVSFRKSTIRNILTITDIFRECLASQRWCVECVQRARLLLLGSLSVDNPALDIWQAYQILGRQERLPE